MSKTDQAISPSASTGVRCWNDLPPEMTIRIFLNLSPSDRQSASRTCKRWDQVFKCPELWHTLTCVFTERPRHELHSIAFPTTFWTYGDNAIRIASNCGRNLRQLWIIADMDTTMTIPRALTAFFDKISESNVQIQELRLRKLKQCELQKETCDELIVSFAKFLRTQNQLSVLQIHWTLPVFYGVILLESLSTQCITQLKELCIHGLICNFSLVNRNRPYQSYVCIWTHLEKLTLNYESLSEDILEAVSTNCMKTLRELGIYFKDFTDTSKELHKIGKCVWNDVKCKIPHLKVRFRIDDAANNDVVKVILPVEMPLDSLNIKKVLSDACFQYLKTSFSKSLVSLKCKADADDMVMTEDMVGSITEFVTSASKLNSLTITAKIPMDIIENLHTLQTRSERGFGVHIQYWEPTEEEKVKLNEMNQRFNSSNKHQKFIISFKHRMAYTTQ